MSELRAAARAPRTADTGGAPARAASPPREAAPGPRPAGAALRQGKVREIFAYDEERLLLVASDRISTFDVVLPTAIPDKGRVLTGLSAFWFSHTREICPNHLLAVHEDGRTSEVRRLRMLPIECVVRGYLAGSGWKDYRAAGATSGHSLPPGLRECERLPEPLFTPATKAEEGHDENIARDDAAALVGVDVLAEVERVSLELYRYGAEHAAERGIILADTKFEFGLDRSDRLVLADEALTPDSSRFWPADEYEPGRPQPSFDKQYVRDYCETLGWDKTPPGPDLPDPVVAGTRARYIEAFERLTGIAFDDYAADPRSVAA
ncbi:MAG: phosphoribosylaminoimidazolesuccinocarboxamide synthase [Thermoleophilia bacterium]|nr:phosphoribosylaminoimidazolesuccinocarboxamide synthase [Thermoleophilia bacterium]